MKMDQTLWTKEVRLNGVHYTIAIIVAYTVRAKVISSSYDYSVQFLQVEKLLQFAILLNVSSFCSERMLQLRPSCMSSVCADIQY